MDPLAYLSLRLCGAVRRAGLDTAVLAPPTLDVARMAEIESLYPTTVAGTFLPGSAPMALTVAYVAGVPTVRMGEFDATRGKRTGEIDKARLVGDRQQCSFLCVHSAGVK